MLAVLEREICGGFVADLKPLKVNDAHKFIAALPYLALLKFHRKNTSLAIFTLSEMKMQVVTFSFYTDICNSACKII